MVSWGPRVNGNCPGSPSLWRSSSRARGPRGRRRGPGGGRTASRREANFPDYSNGFAVLRHERGCGSVYLRAGRKGPWKGALWVECGHLSAEVPLMSPVSAVVARRLALALGALTFALIACQGPDEYFRNDGSLSGAGASGRWTARASRERRGAPGPEAASAGLRVIPPGRSARGHDGSAGTIGTAGTTGAAGRRPVEAARRARRAGRHDGGGRYDRDGWSWRHDGGCRHDGRGGSRRHDWRSGPGRHDGHGWAGRHDGRGGRAVRRARQDGAARRGRPAGAARREPRGRPAAAERAPARACATTRSWSHAT